MKPLRPPRLALAAVALVLLAGAAAIPYRNVRIAQSLMHPERKPVTRPEPAPELASLTDVTLRASDGVTLRGWYVPSRNRAAVVVMHGFAENRAQMLFEARALARAGFGVLLFDSRGHGESGGDLVTWGDRERLDLKAGLDYVAARPDVDPTRLGVFGFSMGGTVALLVAEEDARVRAVAAAGSYPSLEADARYSYGKWGPLSLQPVLWTMRQAGIDVEAVNPMDHLCKLNGRPLLLINGDADPYAPAFLQDRLFQAACEPKTYWVVPGAGHGEYARKAASEYEQRLRDFFGRELLGSG